MQRLEIKLSNRKGFTLILSALLIMVFIGAATMAVDVGHMQVRRAEVHAAADAAALAAIQKYYASAGDSAAARAEARAYAQKFKADVTTLAMADSDFALGFWSGTAFTKGGADTNAARVSIRYTGNYTFAPVLYGHISQHVSSATAVAVGVGSNKVVTQSTCTSPVVVAYGDLAAQLGIDTSQALTQANLNSLMGAKAGNVHLDTLDIPKGQDVTPASDLSKQWVQINVPPAISAAGVPANPGPPSTAAFRDAFDCTGNPNTMVGVGDYIQPINGAHANATQSAIDAIAPGGAPPVTVEVLVADSFTAPPGCPTGNGAGGVHGCFHIKYIAAFTVTDIIGNGSHTQVVGFFSVAPVSGGVVQTDSTLVGPVAKIKTRLTF